jgi:hypothetical protein
MFHNSASSQRFFQFIRYTGGQCKYLERCATIPVVTLKFATGDNDRWCTLTCEYLREFSEKVRNHPNAIIRGLV